MREWKVNFLHFIDPRHSQQDLHERRHQDLQKTVISSSSQSQSVSMKLSELLDDEELWELR